MTRKKHGADASSSSPSPQGRMPQTGARLETGRRRTSRNGAAAFTHHRVRFASPAHLVLACAQLFAGGIGLAAPVIACGGRRPGRLIGAHRHGMGAPVVMRFGRFNRVAGPGIVFTWPVIEFYTVRIDQRVAATYFGAEETLTSDVVPVNVDAVVFWMVFSPKKATVEVEDYASAVAWMAQAMLLRANGRASLAEVACRRDQLDAELKDELEAKLDGLGSTSSTWRCATSWCPASCNRRWPPVPLRPASATPA